MRIFKVNGAGAPEPRFKTRRARKAWRRNPLVAIRMTVTAINPGQNFVVKDYKTHRVVLAPHIADALINIPMSSNKILRGYETWPSPRDGERLEPLK